MSDFSFNLIDVPWIPCVDQAGQIRHLGIRELLANAHELRALEHQNPLTEAALFRVLLAIVHRMVDGPKDQKEWIDLYKPGKLPVERIDAYLQKWHHRFDLFSEDEPFYQTAGLAITDDIGTHLPVSISNLTLEMASGNNRTIFDHTTDETPVIFPPSAAAQALITIQMYALGGLYRKQTNYFGERMRCENAALVDGIFTVLAGSSLFETIMLNLLIYNDNEPMPGGSVDKPVWERSDRGGDDKATPKGYLDYLTCKCRHLLLIPEQGGDGTFVQRIHFAQGEIFSGISNPAFITKKNRDGDLYHPRLDSERLVWRDSFALFAFEQQTDQRPKAFRQAQMMKQVISSANRYTCHTIGMAKDPKQPIVYCWRKESLRIPITLLSEKALVAYLQKAIDFSEKAGVVLNDSVRRYIRESLPLNAKQDEIRDKSKATGATRLYWDRLEGHFQTYLLDIENGDAALETWESNVKRAARESYEICLRERYSNAAKVFRAWTSALAQLNIGLAGLS